MKLGGTLARRRIPDGRPPRQAGPVPAAEALWRSGAFTSSPGGADDGGDVLAAARAGDLAAARGLVEGWIEANPPRPGGAWHPHLLASRAGNRARPDVPSRAFIGCVVCA